MSVCSPGGRRGGAGIGSFNKGCKFVVCDSIDDGSVMIHPA